MKQEEKTERTKNRTIEAAIKEFGKKGYASATIGTICSKYGIAKGLLYHNFTGKKELYLACVSRCFDEVTEYLKAQETDMDLQQYMRKKGSVIFRSTHFMPESFSKPFCNLRLDWKRR